MSNFDKQSYINHLSENNIMAFAKQINCFYNFVQDPIWKNTLSFDMALNKKFSFDVNKYIREIEENKNSIEMINQIMLKIFNKSKRCINSAEKINDPLEAWIVARQAYGYYGLNEVINEGSNFSNYVLDMIKKEYGKNYLVALKKLDNSNPSVLTNIEKKQRSVKSCFSSQLYLLMKQWQDKQHTFHNNYLHPKFTRLRDNFKQLANTTSNNYNMVGEFFLNNTPIMPINILSRFMLAGQKELLLKTFGGKNVGLATLNAHGERIPKTYCISVQSLKKGYYKDALNNIEIKTFSVRSSATIEDGNDNSFAGMFKSCLDVYKEDLLESVDIVAKSVFSERVDSYVKHFSTKQPEMSIVLQEFKEPQFSGVWLGQDLENGHLEWCEGNGEKLVSGSIKPNYEKWIKENSGGNHLKVKNKKIGNLCLELQQKLESVADLEWCVLDNKMVWLQFRPVTAILNVKDYDNASTCVIKGNNASAGKTQGVAFYLETPQSTNFVKGSILLADCTDPDWLPMMLESSAIVTAEGGFLSHAAIISRELGIPCITGIGYENLLNLNEKRIIVDGTKGIIKILKK